MLAASFVRAEEVALNFASVPLVQFAQSTYRAMLKRDFVISPELLATEKPISVSVRSIKSEDLPRFVEAVLSAQGVRSELRDGVYFLSFAGCDGGACSAGGGRSPIPLSGSISPPHGGGSVLDGLSVTGAVSGNSGDRANRGVDDENGERDVYRPRNRRSDFLAAALNAAFQSKPATVATDYVVLSGSRKQLDKMLKLCQEIDEPVLTIRISATFVEVSTTSGTGFGVSVIADVLGARLGVKLGDTSSGALTLKTGNFQAVIDALASDGRFKQVAAPTAIVDNYEKANLSFGDSVPTVASTTLDRNGNPLQQVQYQSSGVLLNVQPALIGSGRINVSVDGQVSAFSATTTGVNGSPTLSKRQVQTIVTLDDGELLILGGLSNNKEVSSRSGFSFLPQSWSAQSHNVNSTDLVLILSASKI